MRALVIADDDSLVGHLGEPEADVLISLGDLWDATISKASERCWYSRVFAVKGNHDSAAPFEEGIDDLHLNVVEFGGLRFGGFCGSWKYKPRGHHMFEQFEVEDLLRSFPAVDVFVAHNSPAGIHERDTDIHQGFAAFNHYIERVQPALFLHGHQHENVVSKIGRTQVTGVYGERLIDLSGDQ